MGQPRASHGLVTGHSRDNHRPVTGQPQASHWTATGQSRDSHRPLLLCPVLPRPPLSTQMVILLLCHVLPGPPHSQLRWSYSSSYSLDSGGHPPPLSPSGSVFLRPGCQVSSFVCASIAHKNFFPDCNVPVHEDVHALPNPRCPNIWRLVESTP